MRHFKFELPEINWVTDAFDAVTGCKSIGVVWDYSCCTNSELLKNMLQRTVHKIDYMNLPNQSLLLI